MRRPNFVLDIEDERLWKDDKPVPVGKKAFQLLRLFAENQGRVLTKDQILAEVWGEIWVSDGLVKEYVHDLRVALGDNPKQPRFIETVRGRGYRFLGGVEQTADGSRDRAHTTVSDKHLPTLAVLPFANLSGASDQEYFADGITEDIIIGLSKNPHLSVISRNSSFIFKGRTVRARDVSKDLGAKFVLEGTVRRGAEQLRVTAQLVDATTERDVWAEDYERGLGDIFGVQNEVVASIVHALGAIDGAVEKSRRQQIARAAITNPSAYDCYLQAREHFYRHADTGYDEAEALYRRALRLDETLARAYSGLATLQFLRFKKYLTVSFECIEEEVFELAAKAVRLDPDDYVGRWILGRLYGYTGKHTQSLAEFDRALRICPNDANLLAVSAEQLVYSGRTEHALERLERAIRLNPNCPDWYWWHLGFTFFHLGRYEEALEALEHMTWPNPARRLFAAVYAKLGRLAAAQAEAQAYMNVAPNFSITEWAKTEPYVDQNELQRYVDGMRLAGLPD